MTNRLPSELPPVPDSVRGVFSSQELELLERYVVWLSEAGVVRGLIGPRETPRLWTRHIMNSAAPVTLLPGQGTVCDVGSGAGLPGIVLAVLRPEVEFTLLEPLLRRTTFLSEVVADLGLDNVEVLRGRAEEFHGLRRFDVVCSRAVAPLDRLTGWCLPLCAPHGAVMALKGSSAEDEVLEHQAALRKLGAGPATVQELSPPDGSESTYVVRVPWADPSNVSLPSGPGSSPASRSRTSSKRKSRRS